MDRPVRSVLGNAQGSTNPGLSLALIGNASAGHFWLEQKSIRGVFDKETRRKPLAFAADAVRYGI